MGAELGFARGRKVQCRRAATAAAEGGGQGGGGGREDGAKTNLARGFRVPAAVRAAIRSF